MIAGRLDRKITIEYPTTTTNDYGEEETEWLELATVWAEVRRQSAREMWAAGKVAETEAMFRIRYRTGIDETCRIYFDETTYKITGVPREIGRKDGLEITAKAIE